MNKRYLIWIITLTLSIGIVIGIIISYYVENETMGNYDLYQCIYNNADSNRFNQNPEMIKEIQNECICFRQNNYTDLLDVNCSNYSLTEQGDKK